VLRVRCRRSDGGGVGVLPPRASNARGLCQGGLLLAEPGLARGLLLAPLLRVLRERLLAEPLRRRSGGERDCADLRREAELSPRARQGKCSCAETYLQRVGFERDECPAAVPSRSCKSSSSCVGLCVFGGGSGDA